MNCLLSMDAFDEDKFEITTIDRFIYLFYSM